MGRRPWSWQWCSAAHWLHWQALENRGFNATINDVQCTLSIGDIDLGTVGIGVEEWGAKHLLPDQDVALVHKRFSVRNVQAHLVVILPAHRCQHHASADECALDNLIEVGSLLSNLGHFRCEDACVPILNAAQIVLEATHHGLGSIGILLQCVLVEFAEGSVDSVAQGVL
jgi:hypothetical protein